MKMFGLIKQNGEMIHVGKEYFLLENGQNWMYGYIQSGKRFP